MAEPRVNCEKTMKISLEKTTPRELKSPSSSDPQNKQNFHGNPPRRRIKNSGTGFRMKSNSGDPSGISSSRPETPLLRWKFDEANWMVGSIEDEKNSAEVGGKLRRWKMKSMESSSRKIGAVMWRLLHSSEVKNGSAKGFEVQHEGSRSGTPLHGHSQDSFEPLFKLSNAAMGGATKWAPVGLKESDKSNQIFFKPSRPNKSALLVTALEKDLERAKSRINELETERRSSKKKLEQFLHKFGEERASWKRREHEKIRLFINDMKSELTREKENRQKLEMAHSKMVNELADAKALTKRCLHEYEKERKAREMIEEVCDELAKEMREDKSELELLKREHGELHDEVEEERKMLQLAEVWREERVQMKLVDAKAMLEEKYSYMNRLVDELKSFLNSTKAESNVEERKKAQSLHQIASPVDIRDVRELTYEPPNPDDIFSIFEDKILSEANEKEIEAYESPMSSNASKSHTASPIVRILRKESKDKGHRHFDRSGEVEEDSSEATSNRRRQLKKGPSSVSELWRSHPKIIALEGRKGRVSNGR